MDRRASGKQSSKSSKRLRPATSSLTTTVPDVGFDYTVNCYRGCIHGCTYCFSRPTHEYLGYGAGTDFDRKIVAKVKAPELLRKELMKPSWKGDEIVFSFTSDPYIPLEANYKLTRRCLEICAEFRNPVGVITKSALIRRDIDVLQELTKHASLGVFFTIPFTDVETARAVEPFAPLPEARFHAMEALAAAGISVGHRYRACDSRFVDRHSRAAQTRQRSRRATGFHQHASPARQRRAVF